MNKKAIITTYSIAFAAFLLSMFYFSFWQKNSFKVGDAWGYYAYLPAVFINHDLDNLDSTHINRCKYAGLPILSKKNPLYYGEALYSSLKKPVIKYTYGISILESPFFFLGHIFSKIFGYKQDGYSLPYMIWLHIGNFLYVLTGLLILYFVLLNWFKPIISFVTTLVLLLSTNLLYFSVFNTGMSHGYLFFLYASLFYCTIQFYKSLQLKYFLIIAFLCGLIVLIRPTEILCVLFVFLYGCNSFNAIKHRFLFFLKKWKWILVAALIVCCIIFPQLYYWKTQAGKWFYDSYPIEHFNFLKPEIFKGLFSFKNGWLIYTPIMLFAFAGLFFVRKKANEIYLPLIVIFTAHVYIIYSWYSWQYVNGYGSRPMVQLYPLLSFSLAAFFSFMETKKILIKSVVFLFVFACTAINILHLFQCEKGTLLTEDATWNLYKTSFGKFTTTRKILYAYDNNLAYVDTVGKTKIKTLVYENFEDTIQPYRDSSKAFTGKFSQHIKEEEFGVTFKLNAAKYIIEKGQTLQFKIWMWLPENHGLYENILMTISKEINEKSFFWNAIRVENKNADINGYSYWWGKQQQWVPVDFCIEIDEDVNPNTDFVFTIWNARKKEVFIDDASVSIWKK